MVEWRFVLCRKLDDIIIDFIRCSILINYGEWLRFFINMGKFYFYYFFVIYFFLILSYVILLLLIYVGGILFFVFYFLLKYFY